MQNMNLLYLSAAVVACYANDNDAFVPEIWAQEGLVILEENMVMANLVHRDFQDEIRDFGDVVNTRRPGTFQIRRKKDGDTLENQDAIATNVQVPLDQWFYTSFTIKDGEASKSFQDLVDIYLMPGMQTIARSVDRAVLGRIHGFFGGPTARVGRLSNLSASNSKDYVLEARERLNVNKAYPNNRNLVLSPNSETALLKNELFIKANERGDGGTALENALLGRILGFDTYMDQNVNSIATGADTDVTGTVTNALAAGSSGSQAVTGYAVAVNTGEFIVVNGNDQPTYVTAHTETNSNTTAITLNEANKYATLASAGTTRYAKCDVQGAYSVGHVAKVLVDGFTSGKAPQVGQLIAFGTGGSRRTYTVIESYDNGSSTQAIYLDRPLEVALTDNQLAFPGPYGSFNWAFHRESIALITRPLALPNTAMGVRAGLGVHNGVSMRVTMQYDITSGGTVVNLDILAGVALLDANLCVPLLG
jgi:hypothetical protein